MEPQKPTSDYLDYHNKVDSGLFKIPKEMPKKYYLDYQRNTIKITITKCIQAYSKYKCRQMMNQNDEPKEKAFSFRVDSTVLKQVLRDDSR